MATIINNPTPSGPIVMQTDSSGWVAVVVILLLLVVGGTIWYFRYRVATPQPQPQTQPAATINVTLPTSQGSSTGSY